MQKQITVVSLGPGGPEWLTLQAADMLRNASSLCLRTGKHAVADWLRENGIQFHTLDALYDQYEDFDALHQAMADLLWQEAGKGPLVFAVADAGTDGAVAALRKAAPSRARLTILPGISQADVCLARLPGGECANCLRVMPAMSAAEAPLDPSLPLLVTELDQKLLAVTVKLRLLEIYPEEAQVFFFASTVAGTGKIRQIPLYEMDRQRTYDHTVCLYVPPVPLAQRDRFVFDDLMAIVRTLRAPGGCPWDAEQTHASLRPCLIEEAYEAAAAIDAEDDELLSDELGDVLLQVAFHSAIGAEHSAFTAGDVISAACRKMIHRHPHVFGSGNQPGQAGWELLKNSEKHYASQSEAMADIPLALPALTRAAKVQRKAAAVGFDWDNAREAFEKILEESDEVREELEASRDPAEELGDLIFSCVNVARLAGCDAEEALTRATDKFLRRFTAMEALITQDGKSLKDLTLGEMDVYWRQVKGG